MRFNALWLAMMVGTKPVPERREPPPPPRVVPRREPDPGPQLDRLGRSLRALLNPQDWTLMEERGEPKHGDLTSGWAIFVVYQGWVVGVVDVASRSTWCAWREPEAWTDYDSAAALEDGAGHLAGTLIRLRAAHS